MKRMTDKTKSYEMLYKIIRTVIYFGAAGVGIAYLIFLFIGQDKRVLLYIAIILLFAATLLWQADIVTRKKLYKNNSVGKRDKKYTVAVCVTLVGGTILTVSYVIMAFCKVSGAFAITMGVIVGLASWVTVAALVVELSVSREIKAEEASKDNSNDESSGDSEENIEENDDETNER